MPPPARRAEKQSGQWRRPGRPWVLIFGDRPNSPTATTRVRSSRPRSWRSEINAPGANPGRQHWPTCYSAILAGGGIRGGRVYGESDKIGAYVKDKPVRPQDLGATIFHSMGVPLNTRLGRDGFTRPLSTGEPILDLFG